MQIWIYVFITNCNCVERGVILFHSISDVVSLGSSIAQFLLALCVYKIVELRLYCCRFIYYLTYLIGSCRGVRGKEEAACLNFVHVYTTLVAYPAFFFDFECGSFMDHQSICKLFTCGTFFPALIYCYFHSHILSPPPTSFSLMVVIFVVQESIANVTIYICNLLEWF